MKRTTTEENIKTLEDLTGLLAFDHGAEYTAGFLLGQIMNLMYVLPKKHQQTLINQLKAKTDATMIPVVNAITGETVMERRGTPYHASVSSESYWSN